jgi:hypothetical protein
MAPLKPARRQLRSHPPTVIVSRWPAWIPLGIHAATAAKAYAAELYALYASAGPEPLNDAYRLLDVDNLAAAVLSLLGLADASGQFYRLPGWYRLQSRLQKLTWDLMLCERLVVTGISADNPVKGKRFAIPADRLRLLEPDWKKATLQAHGRVHVCDVMVDRPALTAQKPVRQEVSEAELRRRIQNIVEKWPPDKAPPSGNQFQALVDPERTVARDRIRAARKDHAPAHWLRPRGRPRRK